MNTPAQIARAIADQAMYELLLSEGVPYDSPATDATAFGLTDEGCQEVTALDKASPALREGFEWLRDRGYVELASDQAGEFITVLRRPGEEEEADPLGVAAVRRLDEIDAAALRSIESDVRHLVESKLPGYAPAVGALRGLQLLMQRHAIARNVGGQLVPPGMPPYAVARADVQAERVVLPRGCAIGKTEALPTAGVDPVDGGQQG